MKLSRVTQIQIWEMKQWAEFHQIWWHHGLGHFLNCYGEWPVYILYILYIIYTIYIIYIIYIYIYIIYIIYIYKAFLVKKQKLNFQKIFWRIVFYSFINRLIKKCSYKSLHMQISTKMIKHVNTWNEKVPSIASYIYNLETYTEVK